MGKEERKQWLLDAIRRLKYDGLVDERFRECYLLKEDSDSRFFLDLVSTFCRETGKVVKKMGKTLNEPLVDFDKMNELCIKLKGSAACIGACCINGACSNLHEAIENNSKEGCLQGLDTIKSEFKRLRSRLKAFSRVERKFISGDA